MNCSLNSPSLQTIESHEEDPDRGQDEAEAEAETETETEADDYEDDDNEDEVEEEEEEAHDESLAPRAFLGLQRSHVKKIHAKYDHNDAHNSCVDIVAGDNDEEEEEEEEEDGDGDEHHHEHRSGCRSCCSADEVCLELSIRSPCAAALRPTRRPVHAKDNCRGVSHWQKIRPGREGHLLAADQSSCNLPRFENEGEDDEACKADRGRHPHYLQGAADAGIAAARVTKQLKAATAAPPPSIQERSLVEFLCARKQSKPHFLDGIVISANVYESHPWSFMSQSRSSADCLYFCCSTEYTKKGNMTRNRMTREGGRWKQQGIVQPILRQSSQLEPCHKTYLSYIPCGQMIPDRGSSSFFVRVPSIASRVKHRHRMIEIALDADLELEKRSLKDKVSPKPFLVVCVLRNTL